MGDVLFSFVLVSLLLFFLSLFACFLSLPFVAQPKEKRKRRKEKKRKERREKEDKNETFAARVPDGFDRQAVEPIETPARSHDRQTATQRDPGEGRLRAFRAWK
jgi:hypothetical protein